MDSELTQKVKALILEVKLLPGSKAKNKVNARLEEAWLWSKEIPKSPAEEIASSCTCPPGAVDAECPVHSNKGSV